MKTLSFELGVSEILKYILNWSVKTKVIAIAGASCSGKTFLAKRLKKELEQKSLKVVLLQLDNYFRDWFDHDMPKDHHDRLDFDNPIAYLKEEFLQAVQSLYKHQGVLYPQYDISENKRRCKRYLKSSPIIIVEGLYALEFLKDFSGNKLCLFVEADREIRLQRRIERDTKKFGVTEQQVRDLFLFKVELNNQLFVQPQIKLGFLDIVIQT